MLYYSYWLWMSVLDRVPARKARSLDPNAQYQPTTTNAGKVAERKRAFIKRRSGKVASHKTAKAPAIASPSLSRSFGWWGNKRSEHQKRMMVSKMMRPVQAIAVPAIPQRVVSNQHPPK